MAILNHKTESYTPESTTLQVKIYAPFKTYYDGPAVSVSALNDTGPFDVLVKHHNFITLLNPGDITVDMGHGDPMKIPIQRGVMHVKSNKVTVFLDI